MRVWDFWDFYQKIYKNNAVKPLAPFRNWKFLMGLALAMGI